MKIKEAIILAGGLGTRLQSAVPNLPKCMAPVAGKPFLSYVIDYYAAQGIEKFIFSLGYKHEIVEDYLNDEYTILDMEYVIEEKPLGTGGAIQFACRNARDKDVLVVNGDTLFKINLAALSTLHVEKQAACTLCLKPLTKFDRYGVVELKEDRSIKSFEEKKFYEDGTINGGVYALNVKKLLDKKLPPAFSFEKDYLEAYSKKESFFGCVQDNYFIDIGIPQDFEKAQAELAF
ncbi:MAG: nucleotidyltransferase family protein [Chitinophagaceae bacterium]